MRPRWLIVGLVASLALNLFLLGAAAGIVALGARMAHGGAGQRAGLFVRATRDLPEPAGHDMRVMLRDAWLQVRPVADQSRQLRRDAWTALADPKPDPAAIKLKLAQSRQLDASARAAGEERLVDYVLTLPPADRAAFVNGMRRALAQSANQAPAKP
jgi:uncharacterized membrane protein